MYKLDPNILNPTEDFDFILNGEKIIEIIELIDMIPSYEILISPDLLSISMDEYPYNSMYENPDAIPVIQYLVSWLQNKTFSKDISPKNEVSNANGLLSISQEIFSKKHSDEFKKMYLTNLIDTKQYSEEYFVTSSSVSTFCLTSNDSLDVTWGSESFTSKIIYDEGITKHLSEIKIVFEANPKHSYPHGPGASILSKDLESRCQKILENSLVDLEKPKNRYGFDDVTSTYVKFMRHEPFTFHAYPVTLNERDIPSKIRSQFKKKLAEKKRN